MSTSKMPFVFNEVKDLYESVVEIPLDGIEAPLRLHVEIPADMVERKDGQVFISREYFYLALARTLHGGFLLADQKAREIDPTERIELSCK